MDRTFVNAYVDYIVVDDEARAIITFTFPHLSENTHVTLIHDKANIGIEPYILNRSSPALLLSAQHNEGIVINVWFGNEVIASGVYEVDTQNDDYILRSICDYAIELMQEGKLSSASDEDFEWVCQFAGD